MHTGRDYLYSAVGYVFPLLKRRPVYHDNNTMTTEKGMIKLRFSANYCHDRLKHERFHDHDLIMIQTFLSGLDIKVFF